MRPRNAIGTLVTAFALFAATAARPQEAGSPRESDTAMAEDLEIFRSILEEAVEGLYGGASPGQRVLGVNYRGGNLQEVLLERGAGEPAPARIDAHAAYIDGAGAIYQFEAPPPRAEAEDAGKPGASEGEPLSRWERARRALAETPAGAERDPAAGTNTTRTWTLRDGRQQEVLQVANPGAEFQLTGEPSRTLPTREALIDRLLEVLVENGHNFRHLAPEERLAIAITFREREKDGDASARRALYLSRVNSRFDLAGASGALGGDPNLQPGSSHEITGDLHLRQGAHDRAREAYEKALRERPDRPELKKKLAQALIGLGRFAEARAVLEELAGGPPAGSASGGPGTGAPGGGEARAAAAAGPSIPLPARLVISATRSQLDQAASGSLTMAEFKRLARVKRFDPPPGR